MYNLFISLLPPIVLDNLFGFLFILIFQNIKYKYLYTYILRKEGSGIYHPNLGKNKFGIKFPALIPLFRTKP